MLFIFFYQQAFLSFLQKKYNSTATSTAISITTSTLIFEIWDEKIMNAKYEEFVKQIFEIEFEVGVEFDFDFDFEMINHLPLPYSSFA
mgnify:CR=1 FL=1